MKKTLLCSLCLLSLSFVSLASCSDGEEVKVETKYKITSTDTVDYEVTPSVAEAKPGTKIDVGVKLLNSDKYLTDILYNDVSFFNSKSATYSFVMPEKDVNITCSVEAYAEVLTDGFATFSSSNDKTLVPNKGVRSLHIDLDASYMTILNTNVVSTNESVIPSSAVTFENEFESQSTVINATNIQIDTTKITKGKTWFIVELKNGNVSSQQGTLYIPLTVSDSISLTKWSETVTIDTSAIVTSDKVFFAYVSDQDYIDGSDAQERQDFENLTVVNDEVSVTMEYVQNHKYFLGFYEKVDGQAQFYDLAETVGSGSTTTGFNQYKDNFLSFIEDNASLTIKVLAK